MFYYYVRLKLRIRIGIKVRGLIRVRDVDIPIHTHTYTRTQTHLSHSHVHRSTLASVTDELLRTENDYVSAMKYVIDNYLPLLNYNGHTGDTSDNHAGELPEQLRGKRYIIFGNLEKIHDFHSKRFQESLRMCKGHPYALGSAFLRHVSCCYCGCQCCC